MEEHSEAWEPPTPGGSLEMCPQKQVGQDWRRHVTSTVTILGD